MHAPSQINVQCPHKLIATVRVVVSTHRRQKRRDIDVGTHDRIEHPFEAEVRDALEAVFEGIDAGNGDCACRGETLAGKQAKEGRFAGAVG